MVLVNHGYSLAAAAIKSYLSGWETNGSEPEWPDPDLAKSDDFPAIKRELRNSHKRKILGVYV